MIGWWALFITYYALWLWFMVHQVRKIIKLRREIKILDRRIKEHQAELEVQIRELTTKYPEWHWPATPDS